MELLYGAPLCKEVLWRRGVLEDTTVRAPGSLSLDEYDRRELDALLADLAPLLTTAPVGR
jgi:dihydrodipicolinate synthase/N-acetylneuraminate lyase